MSADGLGQWADGTRVRLPGELRDLVLFDDLHPDGPRGSEHLCGKCGQCFGSLALFDSHQDVDYTRPPGEEVRCLDPRTMRVSTRGILKADGDPLVLDGRTCWQTPAGLAQHLQRGEQLRRQRQAGTP
jgi:hypothetical protein